MPSAPEITISLLAIAVLWWSCPLKFKLRSLPPGPWPKPLIGNLIDISFRDPWATIKDWKTCFGNVVYIEIFGNKLVLLNSLQAVTDLFEKQGVLYSHRPEAIMVGELMGLDQSIGLSNNDKSWKQQRRLVSIALGPKAFKQHAKTQADLAARMILELHQNQANHHEIINLAAARLIVQITYGHFIKDMTDPYIIKADQVFDLISSSIRPGAYLVDSLPWLKNIPKWLPGSPHRPASKGKAMFEEFIGVPFEHVKLQMLAENSVFIFAASILAAYSINPVGETPLVEPKFSLGLISHPEPFECKFTPRNPAIHNLVKAQLDGGLYGH
ncbi:Cytochrome P450 [Mycena chlorophos]|uniref:Cytochrome P450 n=1 Tax=Mycena chlorophos TaxID=658473 RepID=A0A8H6W9W6_MYCCL|nr:Cytochrome P450 [Mycena chlorophos]